GERVSVEHTKRLLDTIGKDKILHVYGPTESTVYATYYEVNEIVENTNTIPIGKPLSGTSLYVIDKAGRLAPVGVFGELYIGGRGIARGYMNNPVLTAEKFLYIEKDFSHGRVYQTGDLVRWLPGGDIEFSGRIDHQVKIRGFRIEPGEIEDHLLKHPGIEDAIVITQTAAAGSVPAEDGEKYLCAYIVPVQGDVVPAGKNEAARKPGIDRLKEYLSRSLPQYMIPTYFVQLDRMPLTPNGK
ncbi:MAG: amino acid adenylation domain-containing protein, partial [bacterium]|nr:amino acid adenylation domain-containing protein [bacterium]